MILIDTLLFLILFTVCLGFYQIVKQQGRIILRLETLEQQHAQNQHTRELEGLERGAQFPLFSFPDLRGNVVSLESVRGKRVLLVHWNPECGFCDLIAPDLARVQAELEKRNVQLLLLAYGEADGNRKLAEEHGLKCPILLYQSAKAPGPFSMLGTPSAYLLDSAGLVEKPLAAGSDQVPALAEEILKEALNVKDEFKCLPGQKPLSASRIARNGLKAGTPAPGFALPNIYGSNVSLDSYRDRRVLLVFSDPHCGPCDALGPELAQFDREHGDSLAVLMVGRGEIEENRKKAEQHGIRFPVVIQEKWRLSKEYGIFSTPVAFLINEEGVIANDVAVGPDAILDLGQKGLKRHKESSYELSYR